MMSRHSFFSTVGIKGGDIFSMNNSGCWDDRRVSFAYTDIVHAILKEARGAYYGVFDCRPYRRVQYRRIDVSLPLASISHTDDEDDTYAQC